MKAGSDSGPAPSTSFEGTTVIEIVEGLPIDVIGIIVKGRVTRRDCHETLLPAMERALDWHVKLRLYYEIRSRYPGAGWDEVVLAGGQATLWERVAIVSDAAWLRHAVMALRLLIPSEIRVFAATQIPEGLAWIAAPAGHDRPPRASASAAQRGLRPLRLPAQYLHHAH